MGKTSKLAWGLLWQGDKSLTLRENIIKATTQYRVKYKKYPDLCFVHPSLLEPHKIAHVDGVTVLPRRETQKNNYWIGVEKEQCEEVQETEL